MADTPQTFPPDPCPHYDFEAFVNVARIEDHGRFMADIQVRCAHCHTRFRFLGLRAGINLDGAACSVFGHEAHLSIEPDTQRGSDAAHATYGWPPSSDGGPPKQDKPR